MNRLRGYRKWSVALVGILSALVLALLGRLTPEFAAVDIAAIGAFTAGNVHRRGHR